MLLAQGALNNYEAYKKYYKAPEGKLSFDRFDISYGIYNSHLDFRLEPVRRNRH